MLMLLSDHPVGWLEGNQLFNAVLWLVVIPGSRAHPSGERQVRVSMLLDRTWSLRLAYGILEAITRSDNALTPLATTEHRASVTEISSDATHAVAQGTCVRASAEWAFRDSGNHISTSRRRTSPGDEQYQAASPLMNPVQHRKERHPVQHRKQTKEPRAGRSWIRHIEGHRISMTRATET
jgi:hypothetical protein